MPNARFFCSSFVALARAAALALVLALIAALFFMMSASVGAIGAHEARAGVPPRVCSDLPTRASSYGMRLGGPHFWGRVWVHRIFII